MEMETTTRNGSSPSAAEPTHSGPTYRPNVDILEKADELIVVADVPGARAEDIDIQFEDGAMTLHAKAEPRQGDEVDYLMREYDVGDYYRTFRISEQIDATRIEAELEGGVLILHLPMSEAARPRKIPIKSN